jgi:hypothetical protein
MNAADYLDAWRLEQHEERILSSDDRFAYWLHTLDPIQVIRETPDGRWNGWAWRELDRRRNTRRRTA